MSKEEDKTSKKLYLVKKIRSHLEMEVLGFKQEVKLSWWDGMEGAIPVFNNKKDALVYAEGNEQLIEMMVYK